MISKTYIYILLAIAAGILLAAIGLFKRDAPFDQTRQPSPSPTPYIIELQEDGFHPPVITIPRGDTVKFMSTKKNYFWPASDLHPTHAIYAEFDPKEPIESDGTWSFRFEKTGEWRYHDHLAPYFTGTIIVTEKQSAIPKEKECEDSRGSGECWQKELVGTLNKKGLSETFDALARLYQDDPAFPGSCHYLAHNIGIAAYKLFLKDRDSVLSSKAAYCANGFYHGFMEALLTATHDPSEAKRFCAYVKERLTQQAPDAALQCYHGVGHGAMDLALIDKRNWGNEQAMTQPALKLCEQVSDTPEQLYRCASGIFNGIANFYTENVHGLSIRGEDPFWICREQPERYKESCYGNMNTAILWLSKNQFVQAASLIETTQEQSHAIPAMRYLAGLSALSFAKPNPGRAINACRRLQKQFHTPCLEGFAHGILEHGTPDNEYKDALTFCQTSEMQSGERDLCLRYVLSHLDGWYSNARVKQICESMEGDLRKYCLHS
ncbi:MAG: hypothetical protein HY006_02420 [Candidatus Sungbacteria bacterium]|nr:hypothetical protein [Candidatus Sungbacteria bacterium]